MRALWEALPSERRGGYAESSAALEPQVLAAIQPGDAVMVKGSLGSRMGPIVQALERRYRAAARAEALDQRLTHALSGSPHSRTRSALSMCCRYITFRTGGAMVTALIFVFLFGPWIIDHLRLKQGKGQPIRSDGPQSHLVTKKGTPTMGGLMILFGIVVSTLLWANLSNRYVWIVLGVTLTFGAIGFYDDYLKVTKQTPCRRFRQAPLRHRGARSRRSACYFIVVARPPSRSPAR